MKFEELTRSEQTAYLLQRWGSDEVFWMETFLRIVNEDGKLVPFRLSNRPMQKDFVERVLKLKIPRVVELKARRVGGTSLFTAVGIARAHTRKNYNTLLLAQSDPDGRSFMKSLFRGYYDNMVERVELPDGSVFSPKAELGVESERELYFPSLNSRINVATAGSVRLGRGQGFDLIIGTEVARWDVGRPVGTAEETWAMAVGSQQDRSDPLAIQESTAYGAAGFFYETYQGAKRGDNGYLPLFYDWRCHPAYKYSEGDLRARGRDQGPIELSERESALELSVEQARWRRATIADLGPAMFAQEYPEDDETCFRVSGDPFFEIEIVDQRIQECRPVFSTSQNGSLRIWQAPRVGEKYIVACDPTGEGMESVKGSHERDYNVVVVLDGHMNHVATLRDRRDTRALGEALVELCKYYNDALFVGEAGPYGDAVILVVSSVLGYPNVFYEKNDEGKVIRAGLKLTPASKPKILENLKELLEHNTLRSDDKIFWNEVRNFHRVPAPSGHIKLEARAGHDDMVMAMAMGAWAWSQGHFGRAHRPAKIWLPGRS